jgi:hypothetical protein
MIGNISSEITDICLFIEDAFITQSDTKSFFISTVIFVYPLLEKKDKHCSGEYDCNDNIYTNKMKNKKFNYNKEKICCGTKTTNEADSIDNIHQNLKSHKNINANAKKNVNNDFYVEQDIEEYEDNVNFEFDIKYDMKDEEFNNSSCTQEDEYFENDWK